MQGNEHLDDADICLELLPDESIKVFDIIKSFSDVLTDMSGYTNLLHHDIQLVSNTSFRTKSRLIPYSMLAAVNEEVSKMMDLNIIEHSTNPLTSPIVIVKKKDGSNRFCIYFRTLNSQTVFDAEPMPIADVIFCKLATHKFFSKLDLSKGY